MLNEINYFIFSKKQNKKEDIFKKGIIWKNKEVKKLQSMKFYEKE